ncbi:hypothetical protein G6L37_22465 [Agrobacterium rubi]|uniref:ABC-three component system middle component 5 n=1 Tax=Agrobacterium rubi TaxID=28099 RepID=UPI001574A82C|nr:ABC-three component system middle component 5 [Agrobacterium rubi]NTF08897.1 hypothetical protein [Agrobacterium rubi]NTF21168.1 hypothetical protein [Agrobacterium rubi]NTF28025.1 hypothetical protein [Agrobacterium rubi]
MIHLSYHPAFDAFHAIFRILRVRLRTDAAEIEVDKLRILDYYVLFPWRAASIRLNKRDVSMRKTARSLEARRDYATLPTGDALLERMRPSQTAALQTMAQDGFVTTDALRNGIVRFREASLPGELDERLRQKNDADGDVLSIVDVLSGYPLLGPDGLKARTGLLEHRYDKI